MNHLEIIDRFFKGECSPEEAREFEQKILGDPVFAEEVAFYANAMKAAKEEKDQQKAAFAELYRQGNFPARHDTGIIKKLWFYVGAAAVLAALVIGWYLFMVPASPQKLANGYIQQHLQTLGVRMDAEQDSMQMAIRLYNAGSHAEALELFETIIQSDTSRYEAKKFAGIVSLRLGLYDKALSLFKQLESYQLHANPAVFYQALTLLKRNTPGDTELARQLLQKVVQNSLAEKDTAQQWLEEL